jgi:hypothetical protein
MYIMLINPNYTKKNIKIKKNEARVSYLILHNHFILKKNYVNLHTKRLYISWNKNNILLLIKKKNTFLNISPQTHDVATTSIDNLPTRKRKQEIECDLIKNFVICKEE